MGNNKYPSLNTFIFIITILIFSSFQSITSAQINQSLDSLYKLFVTIKSSEDNISDTHKSHDKCGLNIISQTKLNFNNFSNEQKEIIKVLLSRPVLQTSTVSPSGFFRIHYDATGTNTPAYISGLTVEQNVAEVANALDSVYRFEVDYLGYLPPPSDNGAGGDDKYDVYIVNQGSGIYGYTEWESKVGAVNWTSFIVVDNNYTGYYSPGINGLKVTAAHEFHHGIQLGNYAVLNSSSPYRNSDLFFYELSSTSMEEFVYDDVNDYYAYMLSYFHNPDVALPNQNGYNLAIWNIYLQQRFGFEILKQQWQLIPSISAIMAINNTILNAGSSLPSELNTFGVWTYYTNIRTIPGSYFEEAVNYPTITPTASLFFTPPQQTVDMTSGPTANNFLMFTITSEGDTIYAVVTNGDAVAANENPNQNFPFLYTLYNYNEIGSEQIVNNYYYTFSVENMNNWHVNHIFNNVVGVEEGIVTNSYYLSQNFPNPFNPVTTIKYEIPELSIVTLKVYDVIGNEITSLVNEEKSIGSYEAEFDATGLPSGIYFYQLKAGEFTETRKMVLMK